MKNYFICLYIVTFFISSRGLSSTAENQFYNVDSLLEKLTPGDIGTHFKLNTSAPPFLYHWISLNSLDRLFLEKVNTAQMPLKKIGTIEYQSLIVQSAPELMQQKGLFAWHNPVAFYGGSGEIYGDGEVLLELKINPKSRVGVILTRENKTHQITKDDLKNYDLLLHIHATPDGNKVIPIYLEWIIINPVAVTNVNADPSLHQKKLKIYEEALTKIQELREPLDPKNADRSDIERVVGIHHNTYLSAGISVRKIRERTSQILENASRIPSFLKKSGLSFITKEKLQCSGYYSARAIL